MATVGKENLAPPPADCIEDVMEKNQSVDGGGATLSADDIDFLESFPDEKRRRIIRKVDLRVIPVLVLLYLFAYLDKTNIGNAKIEGLLESLNMTDQQYNIALSIFFIPYVLAEVPSNMLLNKCKRPSYYVGAIVILWGIVMTCTGFVNGFAGLSAIRVLLGLFEAGFFPGAILIVSKWYVAREMQTRIALLYTSAATGGGFSGILAFAIAKMNGIAGLEGWRWIFIIEGIATVIVGLLAFLALSDSPTLSSGWLEPDEIRYLELRQAAMLLHRRDENDEVRQHGDGGGGWKKGGLLWTVATDGKIYLLVLASWSNAVPNYALKFAMPSIVEGMGFSSTSSAQLLTVPPYICGAISSWVLAVLADRTSWRMPFIVGPQVVVVVAFAILFSHAAAIQQYTALCYFGVCLACAGLYPIFPGVNAWNVVNRAGAAERAISIAYLVGAGNLGGIIGSYIYVGSEAPRYPTGYGTSMAFAVAGICAALGLEYWLWRLNRRRISLDGSGDGQALFKYTL